MEDGEGADELEPPAAGPTLKAEPQIYQKEEEKKRHAEELKLKVSLKFQACFSSLQNCEMGASAINPFLIIDQNSFSK